MRQSFRLAGSVEQNQDENQEQARHPLQAHDLSVHDPQSNFCRQILPEVLVAPNLHAKTPSSSPLLPALLRRRLRRSPEIFRGRGRTEQGFEGPLEATYDWRDGGVSLLSALRHLLREPDSSSLGRCARTLQSSDSIDRERPLREMET